jgi:hypothetical protein
MRAATPKPFSPLPAQPLSRRRSAAALSPLAAVMMLGVGRTSATVVFGTERFQ